MRNKLIASLVTGTSVVFPLAYIIMMISSSSQCSYVGVY